MSAALDDLAERYSIVIHYYGMDGSSHEVSDDTKIRLLAAMGVAADTDEAIEKSLSMAPQPQHHVLQAVEGVKCYMPDWLHEGRGWGIALQVYSLKSARNWGIGDFADLAEFAPIAAKSGANFIGTNPLHAPFMADPTRRSPFFPSNRRFLNPLYIAVDKVPGFHSEMADETAIADARATHAVDYPAVTALKLAALRAIWPIWKANKTLVGPYAHAGFEAFRIADGEPLRRHALFEALSQHMVEQGHHSGWESWPEQYQSVETPAVDAFAIEHNDEVSFHLWLQWLASVQLTEVQHAAIEAGMQIGLYLDFAVGEAPDGSATWSDPSVTVRGVQVGAPPDYFAVNGQDWGLAPLSPSALLARNMEPYRDMMAASMRYGGALRVDHAMAIWQLFLVPRGKLPSDGAYVRFPIEQMLRALASASHEFKTVIIGEDLGNVPDGFREMMAETAMLSYRILYFEQKAGAFIWPDDYPREAMACLSTHDLPTIDGWWRGDDVRLRRQYDLIDDVSAGKQAQERTVERGQLLAALLHSNSLTHDEAEIALQAGLDRDLPLPAALVVAVHRFMAWTPSRLVAVRLEDLTGERNPFNLPGTVDSYPNWSLKLSANIETLADTALFQSVTAAMRDVRPDQRSTPKVQS